MCDTRKGTSTRKPRLNPSVVQQQTLVQKLAVEVEKANQKSWGFQTSKFVLKKHFSESSGALPRIAAVASLLPIRRNVSALCPPRPPPQIHQNRRAPLLHCPIAKNRQFSFRKFAWVYVLYKFLLNYSCPRLQNCSGVNQFRSGMRLLWEVLPRKLLWP